MEALQAWLGEQLGSTGRTAAGGAQPALQPASADASFRRYFRIDAAPSPIDDIPGRTLIAMDASAERASCGPFVRIARLLASGGLHVPAILAEDLERGWLLLSDLGRQTYLDVLNADNADALFDAAIDALVGLQRISCPPDLPRYDAALLRRELELFPEWYLQRHLGLTIDAALRAQLDSVFELLIERALRQPAVLVHRDYMPRNLMVSEPNPGVLDFQDAVSGPITYDMVSLVRDAFLSWEEDQVLDWSARYWEKAKAARLPVDADFGEFWRAL